MTSFLTKKGEAFPHLNKNQFITVSVLHDYIYARTFPKRLIHFKHNLTGINYALILPFISDVTLASITFRVIFLDSRD